MRLRSVRRRSARRPPPERRPTRRNGEPDAGSVLALVPAGFLILLLLGVLAVDNGAAYLGQRDLSASIEAAANDAAGAALSSAAFYGRGSVEIDPVEAATVVCRDVAAEGSAGLLDRTVSIAVAGDTVYVEGHAEVRAVFGRAIPGLARRPVTAVASAVAATGSGTPPQRPPASGAYLRLAC